MGTHSPAQQGTDWRGYPPANYRPAEQSPLRTPGWLLSAASAVVVLGVLLPWVTITIFTASIGINGTSTGDGKVFLGVAVVSAVFAVLLATGNGYRWFAIITLVAGLVPAAGGGYDLKNISHIANAHSGVVQVGVGLYVSVAAGAALVVVSLVVLAGGWQQRAATYPPGWYPQPDGSGRWWDGSQWTANTR